MSAAKNQLRFKKGEEALVAIIGDEDTVTGFLLAGVGDNAKTGQGYNFLIVNNKTSNSEIEAAFKNFVTRKDIAVLLINQHIANEIRYLLDEYDQIIPAILEIPSKDAPYDPSKDYILTRIKAFYGQAE